MQSNLRLGIWLDDLRLPAKQALKAAAALEPEALGLDAFSAELSPRSLSQTGRRELAHFVRSRGPALAALRADVGGRRLADAGQLDTNLSRLRDALQLAADLGAARLVVAAGFVLDASDKANNPARSVLAEAARALAGLAATSRARVCWQGGSEPPQTLAEFLNMVDPSGILEVDLNPGGYVMRGADPLQALSLLSARVSLASAADHYRGGAEAPFGKGDTRWGEIIVGLAALQRAPVDVLAACSLDGARLATLSAAYKRLLALRQNPVG